MKYILNPNVALRSWRLVPYAYYIRHRRDALGLKQQEFELLKKCDGLCEFSPEEEAALLPLTARGLALPAEGGERLTDWQRARFCDNRYFPSMSWMITGKCNYNCLHCFNAADNAPLQSEFTWEEAERLMDEARDCGIHAVTITGGEPMLHPRFFGIVEGLYERGLYVRELNTNGHFLNDETLSRLKAVDGEIRIKISFDGLGHHDWLRNRKGAEADALRAIGLSKAYGFRTQAQTNVHRGNLDTLLQTAELLDGMGVEDMRIIRTTEAPRWLKNAGDATLGVGEYYDEMFAFLREYIKKPRHMDLDIWQVATVWAESRSFRARPVECRQGEIRDSIPVCRGNRGMVAVTAAGEAVPCHQMSGYYQAHGISLGNVKREGLQRLLQYGPYLSEVCTTLGDLKEANPACRDCRFFPYCAGGCRAIALAFTGDRLGVDPAKCKFFKEGYYDKLVESMGDWHNAAPVK